MDPDPFACEICMERYTEVGDKIPLSLLCGHTFCRSCLEQCGSKCPDCRKAIERPISELGHNFALLHLMTMMGKAGSPGLLPRSLSKMTAEELEREAAKRRAQ